MDGGGETMTGALVILGALILIGVALYLADIFYYRPREQKKAEETAAKSSQEPVEVTEEECCGQHQVCEKTNLSPHTGEIVYYDDEELDRFKGRQAEDYTMEEIEEFRDVLLTLLPQDVAGWSR
ncbi:MAG: phospholipase, partial [Muribaculaceae bacterium]|nr:phospholipase [Muribaculaceae bacterium]